MVVCADQDRSVKNFVSVRGIAACYDGRKIEGRREWGLGWARISLGPRSRFVRRPTSLESGFIRQVSGVGWNRDSCSHIIRLATVLGVGRSRCGWVGGLPLKYESSIVISSLS